MVYRNFYLQRTAKLASVVYVMAGRNIGLIVRLSVCPSVCHTPILCQNEGTPKDAVFTTGSPVPLNFCCQEWLMGDDPVQIKVECKKGRPLWKQQSCIHFAHTSGTVIDSENIQLTRIESRTWAFQRAIIQGRASLLTSPKWGSNAQICRFSQKFRQKPLKVCYKVSLSKVCSTNNYLSNGINILAGRWPRSRKIWA